MGRLRRRRVRDPHRAARLRRPGRRRRSASTSTAGRPTTQDDKVGSLLVNPGGPGAPGSVVAAQRLRLLPAGRCCATSTSSASTRAAPAAATPVDCLSDSRPRRLPRRRPRARRRRRRRGRPCGWRAGSGGAAPALSGDLASHVSTVEAARDIDVLRAALGERVISYFGFSYGTELGATYAELFPTRVGRFVLDGAVDPTARPARGRPDPGGGLRDRAAGLRRQLPRRHRLLLPRRLGRRGPAAHPRPPRPGRRAAPDDHAATAPLTPGWPSTASSRRSTPATPGSCSARRCGRRSTATARRCCRWPTPTPRATSDGTYAEELHGGVPGDQLPRRPRGDQGRRRCRPSTPRSRGLADVRPGLRVGAGRLPQLAAGPRARHRAADDRRRRAPPPIVVVGTTRDPATPLVWAEALASQLDSGVLVDPRRRRPHRLQLRQRLRRRRHRVLPDRGRRARRDGPLRC